MRQHLRSCNRVTSLSFLIFPLPRVTTVKWLGLLFLIYLYMFYSTQWQPTGHIDGDMDAVLLCCKRKQNIFLGGGNSIFTNRNSIHRRQREDGGGRGSQRGAWNDSDGCKGHPLLHSKFKWSSFLMRPSFILTMPVNHCALNGPVSSHV